MYRVYVDEAGDLGLSPGSSRHFVLSAIIVSDADDGQLRSELARLRAVLGRRPEHPLHFVKFSHSQRLKAVQGVASSCASTIVNAVVEKAQIVAQDDRKASINKRFNPVHLATLRVLLARVARWLSENRCSGTIVSFGQLKGFRVQKLHEYRAVLEVDEEADIRWSVFQGHAFRVKGVKELELLQLADIAASAVFKGVEPDRFGNTEPRYLKELRPKLYLPEPPLVSTSSTALFTN